MQGMQSRAHAILGMQVTLSNHHVAICAPTVSSLCHAYCSNISTLQVTSSGAGLISGHWPSTGVDDMLDTRDDQYATAINAFFSQADEANNAILAGVRVQQSWMNV
jgi:hypothetical protein